MDEQLNIIFCEKQKFAVWVHFINFAILIFSSTIILTTIKSESARENPFNRGNIFPLLIGVGLPIILEILFILLKLENAIKSIMRN